MLHANANAPLGEVLEFLERTLGDENVLVKYPVSPAKSWIAVEKEAREKSVRCNRYVRRWPASAEIPVVSCPACKKGNVRAVTSAGGGGCMSLGT